MRRYCAMGFWNVSKRHCVPKERTMLFNKSRLKTSMCLKVTLMVMLSPPGSTSAEPEEGFILDRFLGQSAGLNQTDIASVHSGKAIAVVLDSAASGAVFVAGIGHI